MRRALLAGLAALLLPGVAAAQLRNAQDISTTRSLAMGDAFRAVADSNEAIYFNLAGTAMRPRYEFDLVYGFNDGSGLDVYNGSIVDGKSTSFATGIAYTRLTADGMSGHLAHLGFGLPLGPNAAFGFGFKYLNFSRPEETNAITADIGLLLQPHPLVAVGLAAYNVIDVYSREAPLKAAAGIALGSQTSVRLASDVTFDFSDDETAFTFHAGGEYLLLGAFPLRVGFKRLDREGVDYVTGGIGYVSPTWGFDFAYVQNVEEGQGDDRTFAFAFKMFL